MTPREVDGAMLVQFTMTLRFDEKAMVADLAKAREDSKRAFEAAGFEVKGVRISAAPEPASAPASGGCGHVPRPGVCGGCALTLEGP